MSADVEALCELVKARPLQGMARDVETILDALPEMLRADGAAGDDLRTRLGLILASRPHPTTWDTVNGGVLTDMPDWRQRSVVDTWHDEVTK